MPSLSKPVERIGVGVADARRHDLDQHFARLRPFQIEFDDLERLLRLEGNGGAGLHASSALRFRPLCCRSETRNAALSLAANLAVADHAPGERHRAVPGDGPARCRAEKRLRRPQRPLRMVVAGGRCRWPSSSARSIPAIRATPPSCWRSAGPGEGASYEAPAPARYPGTRRVAATYAHITAPLRRLADRYVLRARWRSPPGKPCPQRSATPSPGCPGDGQGRSRDGQIERAVIDLAEAALLANSEGESFDAVVTDIGEDGVRIQLCDLPVVARVGMRSRVLPGADVRVRLTRGSGARRLKFDAAFPEGRIRLRPAAEVVRGARSHGLPPDGPMAEWLRRGLQILARRFDSGSGLHFSVRGRPKTSAKWLFFAGFSGKIGRVSSGVSTGIQVHFGYR
jgi:hypothetical protein